MKITDFRMKLASCLDKAANGEIISVERGGMTFYLVSSRDVGKLAQEQPETPLFTSGGYVYGGKPKDIRWGDDE